MPFSEVAILKTAFLRLGQSIDFEDPVDGLVASLNPSEPNFAVHVKAAQLVYANVRDRVGRDFAFGATTKYATLALASDGAGEDWETTWENAWVYPSDCSFLRGFVAPFLVSNWQTGHPPSWTWPLLSVKWMRGTHGGAQVIFANGVDDGFPLVEYSLKQTEAADLDVDEASALQWLLAAELASVLIRGEEAIKTRAVCMREYELAVSTAQANSANEADPYDMPDGSWMAIRGR